MITTINLTGWVMAAILFIVIIMNQMTIREYKRACKDYRAAIAIYEKGTE